MITVLFVNLYDGECTEQTIRSDQYHFISEDQSLQVLSKWEVCEV